MPKTEGFHILDVQSAALREDRAKNTAGLHPQNLVRKNLADISNQPQNQRLLIQAKSQSIETTTKEYISQLQKENMALVKMLAQKKEIIEHNGNELDRLTVHLQKMQEQNQQLALSNNQMLVELNAGKDRLKMLQHELRCKTGLLKARKLVRKGRARTKPFGDANDEGKLNKSEVEMKFSKGIDDEKPHESTSNSQRSDEYPCEQDEPEEKTENKRLLPACYKTRNKQSAEVKPAEDLLDTNKTGVSAPKLPEDTAREQGSSCENALVKQEGITECESQLFGRWRLYRPPRAAAKKVQSYKEKSVKVKLRRPE